jgi:hypothetical protein
MADAEGRKALAVATVVDLLHRYDAGGDQWARSM